MGAALILMTVPFFKVTDERKQKIRDFLADEPAIYLAGFGEDYCLFDDAEDDTFADYDRYNVVQRQAAARFVGAKLYEDVLLSLECSEWRDTCNMRLVGMNYAVLISGGLSWGDDPTDACRRMQYVNAYRPLWELLMGFAQEDYVA